jgi:hypothetical protein
MVHCDSGYVGARTYWWTEWLADVAHGGVKLTRTQTFDAAGPLNVTYRGDMIVVGVTPSNQERFVVINERYHPNWRARAEAEDIPIFPTNAVMMGIRIPANLDRIQLRFEPFSSTLVAHMMMLLAVLIFLAALAAFWLAQRRVVPATAPGSATRNLHR